MITLVPRSHGGFPPVQFGAPNHLQNRAYQGGYGKQLAHFGPHYPTHQFYRPPFYMPKEYPPNNFNQVRSSSIGAQLMSGLSQLDDRYRYEQYARSVAKEQRRYWKEYSNYMPTYPTQTGPASMNDAGGTVHHFEREIRYVPYPIYVSPRSSGFTGSGNQGYGHPSYTSAATTSNFLSGTQTTMNLPPKIRVIFIPTGYSSLQQPYIGPLTMPPFLFNRMSQPLCAFPLPPPLPQIGSLSLTPGVQQMFMQRYENPVAVLPFSQNWQMPQPCIPSYPQMPQQQQQQQPQPCIPSYPQMPQQPPPQQQQQQPLMPISCFQTLPPAQQSYIPPPMQSLPPAPQSYIPPPPPPPAMPTHFPVPSQSLPPPFAEASTAPPIGNYSHNGYPGMCRACPPAPPSLDIPVRGHCWVQHCSACHHVPTPTDYPNARPNGGRVTPLLRHPTVPQYVPYQTMQQQSNPHVNAPIMMRPWLRKTPPLPPGAVLISDEYITRNRPHRRHHESTRQSAHYQHYSNHGQRSSTVTSTPTTSRSTTRNVGNKPPIHQNSNHKNKPRHQEPGRSKSVASPVSSLSTSASGKSSEYEKVTMYSSEPKHKIIPEQLASEARNVTLQYNYQAQELPSVYLHNCYVKSSSEHSTLSCNLRRSIDRSPSLTEKYKPNVSPSIDANLVQDETKSMKEEEKSIRSLLPSNKSKEKRIIIREFLTSSPSTISTRSSLSSNTLFSIIDNDFDSISTTSTLKSNLFHEGDHAN